MKIRDVMTRDVHCCGPETDLAAVAMMMWRGDCGIVPVLEEGTRRVVGVVTDRDICMAAATRHEPPGAIRARSIAGRAPCVCRSTDSVQAALDAMAAHQVRRLPVVNAKGQLEGIVSLNDLVLRVEPGRARRETELTAESIVLALRRIGAHRTEGSPPGERRRAVRPVPVEAV